MSTHGMFANCEALTSLDLSGRMIERPQRGVNIFRKEDGTTRKVIVK